MKSERGKRVAIGAAMAGIAVIAGAAFVFREAFVEQYYIWRLNSGDEAEREIAADKLGELRSLRAIPGLVGLARGKRLDPLSARRAAAEALKKIGPAAVPLLLEAQSNVRNSADWDALSDLALHAVKELIDGLRHHDPQVRLTAVYALGNRCPPSPETARALVQALKDPYRELRREAACHLERFPLEKEDMDPLLQALKRENEHGATREYAALALARIGEPALTDLIECCRHADPDVRQSALAALRHLDPFLRERAVPTLVEGLKDENEGARTSAAWSLAACGKAATAALPRLVAMLEDPSDTVRRGVLYALMEIGPPVEVVPRLIGIVLDEKEALRLEAITVLASMGARARGAVPALLKSLKDADPGIRRGSAEALGRLGARAAVPSLIEALRDEKHDGNLSAAEALGAIGAEAKDAIPALVQALTGDGFISSAATLALLRIEADAVRQLAVALKSEDWDVRQAAARALGAFGPRAKDAVPELTAALADEDPNVVLQTADTLGLIGPEAREALPALLKVFHGADDSWDERMRVARALGRIGPAALTAVPNLLGAIEDEYDEVRAHAALALGRIGTDSAEVVLALRKLLSDERLLVQCYAALALLHFGERDPGSQEILRRTLRDPSERFDVLNALEAHPAGMKALLGDLIELLKEDDVTVRSTVLRLLGKLGPAAKPAGPAIQEILKSRAEERRRISVSDRFWAPKEDALAQACAETLRRIQGEW